MRPDDPLDQQAYLRGNSVYFPTRVIPMLPEILSNQLCSLRADMPKRVLCCQMHFSSSGARTACQFYPAWIQASANLTYEAVAKGLKHDFQPEKTNKNVCALAKPLSELAALYTQLAEQRHTRHALAFTSRETHIIFDRQQKIKTIHATKTLISHKIIEECMLAANVCAAETLHASRKMGLYRIHNGPEEEKLAQLQCFLSYLNLRLPQQRPLSPQDYMSLIRQTASRPDAGIIQKMLLRSLSQAVYQPQSGLHFGLAYPLYTHFTSPIRRYPDLIVHRALYAQMKINSEQAKTYTKKRLKEIGEHCSYTERRAEEATRDVVDWLKCVYMQDKVGDAYHGIVNTVTPFGLFVELPDLYVEGLVHITALQNDYYQYDPGQCALLGQRTGRIYRLGQPLHIVIAGVNLEEKKLDFVLNEPG